MIHQGEIIFENVTFHYGEKKSASLINMPIFTVQKKWGWLALQERVQSQKNLFAIALGLRFWVPFLLLT